ncbi:transposase, partial [Methanobrevibacter filiformis]|uniref:transposase n=1 Tax=Methanobrevibacter filiformis TaxID=55758 RepID=UPI000B1F9331
VVDCDSGIILNSTITKDPTDHYQLPIQIEQLQKILDHDLTKSRILADNGFNTQDTAKYLHDNGFDAYMPSKAQASADKNKKPGKFSKANFTRNYEKDCFICPLNEELPFKNEYEKDNKFRKVYYTNKCKNCPYKSECSPKSNYRIITVYTNKYQDALEIKLNIPENKEIYKRRIVVERSFAH